MLTMPAQALEQSRVDLIDMIRQGVPAPACVPGGSPWLLAGKRYLMPAPAGTGKSLVALTTAVAVVQHGGRVLVLDVENGAAEYAGRLQDILRARDHDGTLAEACQERLHYHAFPDLNLSWTREAWAAATARADLVIFDSSRFCLSQVGLAEDKADDYSQFVSSFIMPLATGGACTLMLDNTGHGEHDRARGTSSKSDLNEVVYALKVGTPFDRERAGHLRLVQTRSRFAGLPRELHVHLGADTYTAPVPVAGEDSAHEAAFRPTGYMERASTTIEAQPGLSKRSIRTAVGGKSEWIDLALELLVSEGYAEMRREGQAIAGRAVDDRDAGRVVAFGVDHRVDGVGRPIDGETGRIAADGDRRRRLPASGGIGRVARGRVEHVHGVAGRVRIRVVGDV
jgi:hypothetical protein